ncbi:MAG: response regulator [Magnetococcales bacterium]|nr:response regulator [Nitrospirota bacterium]
MNKVKKVLVIDNEENVCAHVKRVFEMDKDFDFEVTTVYKVEEALSILEEDSKKEGRFDVVVIDLFFPPDEEPKDREVLKGRKILEKENLSEISRYFPKVKIVFSAHPDTEYVVEAMKLGACNYIVKEDKDGMTAFERLLNVAKEELKQRGFVHEPDYDYMNKHFDEWRENYYNEYLAFINGLLVGHGPNEQRLIEKVKEKYPNENPYIMLSPGYL